MRNNAIVISTYHGREDWSSACTGSLNGFHDCPILTVAVPYELNVIRWVYEHTDIDEFLFLQDTVVVKHHEWIRELFDIPGSVSLSTKPYFMYLGKYTRETLGKVPFPKVETKRDAVAHEDDWTMQYVNADGAVTFLWQFFDTDIFEHRNGRENMVLENEHIIKYKGTWRHDQVEGWYA